MDISAKAVDQLLEQLAKGLDVGLEISSQVPATHTHFTEGGSSHSEADPEVGQDN